MSKPTTKRVMDVLGLFCYDGPMDTSTIRRPFFQGDYIVATNGHLIIYMDKDKYPELQFTEQSNPPVQEMRKGFEDFESEVISPDFMSKIRAENHYHYEILRTFYNHALDEEVELPDPQNPFIIWSRIFDLMYLSLVEIAMYTFGGEWKVYLPDDKLHQCVFTNGSELIILMPMNERPPK